jgi:farnesol dehydrogenase
MRVLLTGGTGYLGRAIARALARRGHEPVIYGRSASAAVAAGVPGRAADGDVRNYDALHAAADGCEALCHSAALVAVWQRRRQDFHDVNVGGLRNALMVAASRRLARIVYTSSFLALPPSDDGRPLQGNDYQRSKAAAEHVAAEAAEAGVPIVRLYPGVVYGPGELTEGNLVGRLVHDHLRRRLPGVVGADRLWSFAWIDDVADAHVSALERAAPASAYALGGENAPQMCLYEIVRNATGRSLPRRIPVAMARALAIVEEVRAQIPGTTPRLTRGTVEVLRHDWSLDSSAAMRDLGYSRTPLNVGVSRLLASLGFRSAEVPNLQPR